MPDSKKFEKQFFNALRDIFVGAKVEGESGYVNLMRIKSRYYEQGVFPQLQKDINAALLPFPDFREELFDKLYTFFQRYFSESGSIYFRYTALHQNIYEKVYTDDRDVILFWKTHMLYYVKTDRIFTSLNVEVDGAKFFFDAGKMTLKKSNEKREVVYTFRKAQEDGTLVFDVTYSEKGKTTKVDDILKDLKKAGVKLSDETLNKAFRVFEKQSEVDYFINKNARAFLQEQFDLWMYQYLFAGQNIWGAERLAQLQALKAIAYKVIDFISQFEDELVKIWNKPKFVRNSHYVLTLDKLAGSPVLDKLLTHPNLPQQVQEWRDLGMIGEDFQVEMLTMKDLTGGPLYPQYQFLPVDTHYISDLELEILGLFDNLDASLSGWLIHSENYQALSTLAHKFKAHVKTVFIDPPYNTGSDEFHYKDKYRHSSWSTLMENRLSIAKELMSENGALFATINDIEVNKLRLIAEEVFGVDNFVANIVWQKKQSPQNDAINLSDMHDHIILFAKRAKTSRNDTNGWQRNLLSKSNAQEQRYLNYDNDPRGEWTSNDLTVNKTSDERPNLYYGVENPITGEEIYPSKRRVWIFEKAVFLELMNENRIWWGENGKNFPRLKRFKTEVSSGLVPSTWWTRDIAGDNQEARRELRNLFTEDVADNVTPKPTKLVETILTISGDENSTILDFFAGSGTSANAAINLNRADGGNRKYIIIEMGEHFNTVVLPRIKKVTFSSSWKDGRANGGQGISQFIKYYEFEQYEDVLRCAHYADADLFNNPYEDPYHRYVFLRDVKLLDSIEIDANQNKVHFHPDRLYPDIDLAETLSQRRGKWIKRITAEYVEFQDGEKISLTDPDWQVIKPLIWWQ